MNIVDVLYFLVLAGNTPVDTRNQLVSLGAFMHYQQREAVLEGL